MTAKPEIRGSQMLGTFDQILHYDNTSLRAIELVGRGISAKARCTFVSAEDKTRDSSGLSHAERMAAVDKLIELGDLEDELEDLWQQRRANQLTAADFDAGLQDIVQRLEAWPAHLVKR